MICLASSTSRRTPSSSASSRSFVYTGAVMMLFLFVLMLVGVDSSDSLVETIRASAGSALLLGARLRRRC